ncbi:MAG: hypothetical protein GYA40_05225 [Chloroflexi bacterium]|nr:hypothetical protein [Chloroflexota bacterium]
MDAIIKFLADLEVPIYLILGVVAVVYLRRLTLALDERKSSVFGLEREAAQTKVVSAATVMILVALLAVGEFIVATFLAGELAQQPLYATPTITVLTTPTTTLPAGPVPTDATPTPTPYPQAQIEGIESSCQAEVLEISEPKQGSEVSGVVELIGSVNTPNFGSYQYEYSVMGEPNWQTIAAGSGMRIQASLGFWYTTNLVPGDYMLRLVALDNQGERTAACVIVVKVSAPQE